MFATALGLLAALTGLAGGCRYPADKPAGPLIEVGEGGPQSRLSGIGDPSPPASPAEPTAAGNLPPSPPRSPPRPPSKSTRVFIPDSELPGGGSAGLTGPAWEGGRQIIRLAAARGEVVSFQLDFVAPTSRLQGMRLALSDLDLEGERTRGTGPARIDRSTIEVSRAMPVRVKELPGWYQLYARTANRAEDVFYDALVPIDNNRWGQPWNLAAGERLTLWADVPVPPDARPGSYLGQVIVLSSNQPSRKIEVQLEVLPVDLPSAGRLTFLAPIDVKQMLGAERGLEDAQLTDSRVYGDEAIGRLARRRLGQWMELARDHGVQLLPADLAPYYRRDLAGKVEVDWAGYDRLCGPFLVGPDAPPIWLAPFRLDYPSAGTYGGLAGRAYAELAEQFVREIGRHFYANKWPQPMAWIHRDRPAATRWYGGSDWRDWLTEGRRAEAETIGKRVHQAEVPLGYLESLPWSAELAADLAAGGGPRKERLWGGLPVPPHVSVYCPPAQMLDPATIAALRARRLAVWLGDGTPPWRPSTAVFGPTDELQAFSFLAWRYGLDTVWLGPVMTWPGRGALAAPLRASEAEFLFYPGQWFEQDRPVASLRLKQLRRARQDYGYLWLLSGAGRAAVADHLARMVAKYALSESAGEAPGLGGAIGWLSEPALYAEARTLMRQELSLATAGEPPTAAESGRARSRWMAFVNRAAWVQLGLYPGQLIDQVDRNGAPNGRFSAVFRVSAFADEAALASLVPGVRVGATAPPSLVFGRLPDGWAGTRYNVPVEATGPGAGAAPLVLLAEGRDLAIDRTGRVPVPIAVRTADEFRSALLGANVPVLVSYPFPSRRAPRIDGELGDWPNPAGWPYRGAGFVRLTPAQPVGGPAMPPPLDTWTMAGHDDQWLYLAVVCLGQASVECRPTNLVSFDHGLVTGEDALEVILDPTGGRLDRHGLFHLLVKANGTTLGWRSATGADRLDGPEPWGRRTRVAIGKTDGGWLAELAIDRAELGQTNEAGLWRLNVVRHMAAKGEHSAWASHLPDVSDPQSLGNLLLRRPPALKVEVPLAPPSFLDH